MLGSSSNAAEKRLMFTQRRFRPDGVLSLIAIALLCLMSVVVSAQDITPPPEIAPTETPTQLPSSTPTLIETPTLIPTLTETPPATETPLLSPSLTPPPELIVEVTPETVDILPDIVTFAQPELFSALSQPIFDRFYTIDFDTPADDYLYDIPTVAEWAARNPGNTAVTRAGDDIACIANSTGTCGATPPAFLRDNGPFVARNNPNSTYNGIYATLYIPVPTDCANDLFVSFHHRHYWPSSTSIRLVSRLLDTNYTILQTAYNQVVSTNANQWYQLITSYTTLPASSGWIELSVGKTATTAVPSGAFNYMDNIELACVAKPAPTLVNYGIATSGSWTQTELDEILAGVTAMGQAFAVLAQDGLAPNVKFKQVMGVESPTGVTDQGVITLIKDTSTNPYCIVNNGNRTITCGNLLSTTGQPLPMTRYVIVHEMGHVFDNQSARNNNVPLRDYIAVTGITLPLYDDNGFLVMGNFGSGDCPTLPATWGRGERGWGSGPGSTYKPNPPYYGLYNHDICGLPDEQNFTTFQQHPAPYLSDPYQETAADMFVNWVFRTIYGSGNGFLDRTWKPTDSDPITGQACNIISVGGITVGCSSTVRGNEASGQARFDRMNLDTNSIFTAHGW